MPRSRAPQAQEPNQVGFLDLPAETRNEIYTMWAQDVVHVYIRAKGKAYTTAAHPVTRLNHIVHREFTGVLAQTCVANAQRVTVRVEDLNFYPLITFLKRVLASPDADYRNFQHQDGRALIVHCAFTKNFSSNPPVDNVARWLRFEKTSVPGLSYEFKIADIADVARTKKAIESMANPPGPASMWVKLREGFTWWEARQAMLQPAPPPQPKTALEQAVEDYYNAIYAEMDARDAAREAADEAQAAADAVWDAADGIEDEWDGVRTVEGDGTAHDEAVVEGEEGVAEEEEEGEGVEVKPEVNEEEEEDQ